MVCDFNDENNFPHKLLLTNIQVSTIHKVFENGSLANIIFFQKLNYLRLYNLGEVFDLSVNLWNQQ